MSSIFDLKGSVLTITVIHLNQADLVQFEKQLAEKIKGQSDFFQKMPIIVNLANLADDVPLDLKQLKLILERLDLIPIALRNIPDSLESKAKNAGWAIYRDQKSEKSPTITIDTKTNTSKKITVPIRSGQQIYAKESDLTLLNTVSTGAEVLADGDIHAYGAFRGRALAGAKGDKNARIFCQSLQAELVSIAGIYKVIESIPEHLKGKAVQIYLHNDELQIEPLL